MLKRYFTEDNQIDCLAHKQLHNRMSLTKCKLKPQCQKEKNKCILMHMYGIQKNGTDEPICRAGIETQTQRADLWTAGEGEGGTN